MKPFQLTAIFFIISLHTYSQEFSPGKVIRSKGDTLYGFIQDTGIKKMVEVCWYKKNLKSTETLSFKPFEIQSYEVNDKMYTSKIFMEENGKKTNAFLLQLIGGRVSMYQYNEFYLVEKNNSLQILSKKDTIIRLEVSPTLENLPSRQNDKTVFVSEKIYHRYQFIYQLDSLFIECPSRHSFLNTKTRFTVESISGVVIEYNKCIGELDYVYKKPNAQKRFYAKLLGGSSSVTYGFGSEDTYRGGMWGIGLNYQIAGDKLINKRFISQFEVDFAKYSFSETDYKSSILSFGLLMQYAFKNPDTNGFPYLEAGVKGNMYLNVHNFSAGFPIGLGWQTGWNNKTKIQFSARYFQFRDAPFYNIKNVIASFAIAF